MGQVSETDYGFKLAEKNKIKLSNEKMNPSNNNNNNNKQRIPTFAMDETLPPLPLPNLTDTLNKYLESIKPFVTELEYLKSEKLVRDFENGIGQKLHFHLTQKANREKNWWRLPIAPFINTSGLIVGTDYDQNEHKELQKMNIDIQFARASFHAYFMSEFFELLRKELVSVQQSRNKFFSMDQFRRFYNTCRIPQKVKDRLDVHFRTEKEGPSPTHFLVIYKNRFFKVNAYHSDNKLLNISELHEQFKKIGEKCKSDGIGIGALTGDNRDDWADNREYLINYHPENKASLELIEKALFVIALDDCIAKDLEDTVKYALYKNPKNRFFDKAYTHVITKNGLASSNTEHSAYDGICSATVSNYIFVGTQKSKLKLTQVDSLGKRTNISEPTELVFHYDTKIGKAVKHAIDVFERYSSNLDFKLLTLSNCDKNTLKSYKINPDTFTQMCMQLAYYQLHKKPAPTYETATTRQYYHGRTETVRSCTIEALKWCQAMCNTDKSTRLSDLKLLELFKTACNKHDKLMSESRENHGCDRHLLGLMLISKEMNLDLPEIYKDESWTKSGGNGNFIISSSCLGFTNVNGGCAPMCTNGYTMIYCFSDYGLNFSLGRYKDSKETDLEKIAESLKLAFIKVQSLFEAISKI